MTEISIFVIECKVENRNILVNIFDMQKLSIDRSIVCIVLDLFEFVNIF